ncbi:MAG: hypothetical protein HY699_24795 [Deltaproteobacteria bacterium]|nr:hypothetical protein [Deltaproteobacteria bacterium]
MLRALPLVAALLAVLAAACQDSEQAVARRPVTPLDLDAVGAIVGEVQFAGPVPPSKQLQLGAWADCAKQHTGPVSAGDVLVNNGKLQNVVVYVKQGLGERGFAVPDTPVVIDQVGCLFVPRVAVAQAGQPVRFLNSDPLAHNVRSSPKAQRGWNFMLAAKGTNRTITVAKPENVIELKCDVHPWMAAYLGVFDHPYAAVSGADGRFEFKQVPPGEYVIEAWHERFGVRSATLALGQKETREVAFTFTAEKAK